MNTGNINRGQDSCCDNCGDSTEERKATSEIKQKVKRIDFLPYIPAVVSFALLITGILFRHFYSQYENSWFMILWFLSAYFIVGRKTVWKAIKLIPTADLFNEYFLMTLATVGAFAIGEYAEGVAVMLFYEVGELFNDAAVKRARKSIKALMDIRPDTVTVLNNNQETVRDAKEISPGEIMIVKPGERVALDGDLLSQNSSFNAAALTGESKPATIEKGEKVLAGMINLNTVSEIKVTSKYENSALAKIMDMVQHALARKASTERFIRKFAKVYTPIVVILAIALTFLPYFFVEGYIFRDWLYRALIFLVISCPCALVISIPLGYFGGIGAASRNGILFKGSDYLDQITKVNTVVMDKTGTLTKGVFKVQEIRTNGVSEQEFLKWTAALESKSTHPIAKAIAEYYTASLSEVSVADVEEIAGHGLKGKVNGNELLAGNPKLLRKFNIPFDPAIERIVETIVVVAINGEYKGYITIADEIKEDAQQAVKTLHQSGVRNIVMLSGDKDSVVQKVAERLSIDKAYGGLLPEDKVKKVEELKKEGNTVAFVGDGVNDAPVIALADVGIAMGGLGSDATIETADVVIQTDQPSKISMAIKIGNATRKIVWQNIALAFGIKFVVLALGTVGIATMWEAVFADVGVALLAILNAVRIQKMKF